MAKPGVQRRKRGDYCEVPEELMNGFKNNKKDDSNAINGRPEILRKRSREHSKSPEHRELTPREYQNPAEFLQQKRLAEQVKLEPITVRSLETNHGKPTSPLFEIVVNPMDLSVKTPSEVLNHHPKKRMLLPSSTEICDPNIIKRSRPMSISKIKL